MFVGFRREKAKKERMMNGNFNLFFGVDVGSDPGGSDPGSSEGKDSKDSKDSKENLKVWRSVNVDFINEHLIIKLAE